MLGVIPILILPIFCNSIFHVSASPISDTEGLFKFINTLEFALTPKGKFKDPYALPDKFIENAGYKVKVHTVETPDGHLIPLYQVGPPQEGRNNSTRHPVLLMPGLTLDASCYLFLSPEKALPYILVNAGFDVWIGNYRGCEGTSHKNYSRKENEFWRFGLDEIASIDLPAIMDYILLTTHSKTLSFVGHSLSTAMFFAEMALVPQYNVKIRKMVGLATANYLPNATSMLSILKYTDTEKLLQHVEEHRHGTIGFNKFRGLSSLSFLICNSFGIPMLCLRALLPGFEPSRLNATTWTLALKHFPSYASGRLMAQTGQISQSNTFARYDFGPEENQKHYGSPTAPIYPVDKVTADVLVIYSDGDTVSTPQNAIRTFNEIGSKNKLIERVPRSDFTHMDYLTDDEVVPLVYNRLVEYLSS